MSKIEKTERNKVHTIYRLADGTIVPSVTTCLDILAKPALIHWSWQCGVEGLDYRKVRDQSGSVGTLVHAQILNELSGNAVPWADDDYTEADKKLAENCLRSWHKWAEGKKITPILLETPLVSEKFRYGGTPDFCGYIDDTWTLLDFKTSGAIYLEYHSQLAAYGQLLWENGYKWSEAYKWDEKEKHPAFRILRISKEPNEDVEDSLLTNLEPAWEIFLACQKIYEQRKRLKKNE